MELEKCPLTIDEKNKMISESAFYKSEDSNREKNPVTDWLEAEEEVEDAITVFCHPFET